MALRAGMPATAGGGGARGPSTFRTRRGKRSPGEAVATPTLLHEDEGTAKDFGFEQRHREQTNELNSIGFNAAWQVSDAFSLSFDIHDSKAESLPSDPVTGGGDTAVSFA